MMYCLGIESTAHTFGASIVRFSPSEKTILSNVRDVYTTEEGGLIPAELSEHHVELFDTIIAEALKQAGVKKKDVTLIAYSRSPGIGHALRIGAAVARALALRLGVPLIGVNHCVAHLEIGRVLGDEEDPVLLYASGANTQIIAREGGAYRIFGETLDLGVGNFIDTVARLLGQGFPGGPHIERLAKEHEGSLLELPYSVKGMDVSFSGMQTAVKTFLQKGVAPETIAHGVQEHAFAMLVEVAERALAHTQKKSLVLGGGVACNKRLQEMCALMCADRDVRFFVPENQYLVDNGAMIALLGIELYERGYTHEISKAGIHPYERTDEVPEVI